MKICIIGTGNVATRFAAIFGVEPVSARTPKSIPTDADLYLIAVSDAALEDVAKNMPEVCGVVAHTTGSVGMEVLKNVRCKGYGVFYPLQTLSKTRSLSADKIPLMLEADNEDTLRFLRDVADDYGFTIIRNADSDARGKTHLAAAFACNFVNAMIGIGADIMEKCGLEASDLQPLIEETIAKLHTMSPRQAQTGPAARNDIPTMERHLARLQHLGMTEEEDLYRLVSDIIRRNSQKKDSPE